MGRNGTDGETVELWNSLTPVLANDLNRAQAVERLERALSNCATHHNPPLASGLIRLRLP